MILGTTGVYLNIYNIANISTYIWVFPKIVVPQNGWFKIMENPIKMDDLGVPLFLETPIYIYISLTYTCLTTLHALDPQGLLIAFC